jgi:hypothetical protein
MCMQCNWSSQRCLQLTRARAVHVRGRSEVPHLQLPSWAISDRNLWMQMDVGVVFLLVLGRFILGFNRGFKLKDYFLWKVELGCLLTALSSMLFYREGYVPRAPSSLQPVFSSKKDMSPQDLVHLMLRFINLLLCHHFIKMDGRAICLKCQP